MFIGHYLQPSFHLKTIHLIFAFLGSLQLNLKNKTAVTRETPDSDNDVTCAELKADEGWKKSVNNSRPVSIASEPEDSKWINIVTGKRKEKSGMTVHTSAHRKTNVLQIACFCLQLFYVGAYI